MQGLGWSTPWAEDCSAKSLSQFLSVPFSCPTLSQLNTFTRPVSCLLYRRLSSSTLPESSLTTAVNYRAHSHSDRQEVGTAIAAQKS